MPRHALDYRMAFTFGVRGEIKFSKDEIHDWYIPVT